MKKYDLIVGRYFTLFTIPCWVIITITAQRGASDDWLNASAGLLGGLWFAILIYILVKMVFVHSYRETLLGKIFQQRISDERENLISGVATKNTYFFTSAIILMLLFFSVLKISYYNPTQEDRAAGKKGYLSFGLGYSIVSENAIKKDLVEFKLQELPLSKECILSLILLLQFVSYHRYFRKQIPG